VADCTANVKGSSWFRAPEDEHAIYMSDGIAICILEHFREESTHVRGYKLLADYDKLQLTCNDIEIFSAATIDGWGALSNCRIACDITEGCVGFTIADYIWWWDNQTYTECVLRGQTCAGSGGSPLSGEEEVATPADFYWKIISETQETIELSTIANDMAAANSMNSNSNSNTPTPSLPPSSTFDDQEVVDVEFAQLDGGANECICSFAYHPVCGIDYISYSNVGCAACAGTQILHAGLCTLRHLEISGMNT